MGYHTRRKVSRPRKSRWRGILRGFFNCMKSSDGFILLARKIKDSDIWNKKPIWLKIWIYILLEVNHSDSKFSKGTGFFRFDWICQETGASYWQVEKCIKYLKQATQITTQKATQGIVISVLNYAKYQSIKKYYSNTENNTPSNSKATQKQLRGNNIYKEGKKDKEEKEIYISEVNSLIKEFETINPTINYGNKTERQSLEYLISKYGYEKTLNTVRAAIAIQGQQYAPVITTPYQLKQNMGKLLIYYSKESNKKSKFTSI